MSFKVFSKINKLYNEFFIKFSFIFSGIWSFLRVNSKGDIAPFKGVRSS